MEFFITNSLIIGRTLAVIIIAIYVCITIINKDGLKRSSVFEADVWINLVKGIFYIFSSLIFRKIYIESNIKVDVKDAISSIGYILTLLEGVHCMINSIGNAIMCRILKK